MSVREFASISNTINALIENGYTNDNFAILLGELDICDDPNDTVKLLQLWSDIYICIKYTCGDTYDDTIELTKKFGVEQFLVICDELSIRSIISCIVDMQAIQLPNVSHCHLINVMSLGIVSAYNRGYKPIGRTCEEINDLAPSNAYIVACSLLHLNNAFHNGLYAPNIFIDEYRAFISSNNLSNYSKMLNEINDIYLSEIALYTDDHAFNMLSACTNLQRITNYHTHNFYYDADIETLRDKFMVIPFIKNLTSINDESRCLNIHIINDKCLNICTNLRILNVSRNTEVTTCAPFAKTLRILYANGCCGICDDGLKLCDAIKELYASDNPNITTLRPFAKKLKKLDAPSNIDNTSIALCTNLKYLDIYRNYKITTCTPFVKTLRHLRDNVCLYHKRDRNKKIKYYDHHGDIFNRITYDVFEGYNDYADYTDSCNYGE